MFTEINPAVWMGPSFICCIQTCKQLYPLRIRKQPVLRLCAWALRGGILFMIYKFPQQKEGQDSTIFLLGAQDLTPDMSEKIQEASRCIRPPTSTHIEFRWIDPLNRPFVYTHCGAQPLCELKPNMACKWLGRCHSAKDIEHKVAPAPPNSQPAV